MVVLQPCQKIFSICAVDLARQELYIFLSGVTSGEDKVLQYLLDNRVPQDSFIAQILLSFDPDIFGNITVETLSKVGYIDFNSSSFNAGVWARNLGGSWIYFSVAKNT